MKFLFLFFYNFIDNLIHIRRIKNFMKQNVTLSKPIIFDVGSHKGKMTRLFRNLYKNAKIYCFEPNIEIVKSLKKITEIGTSGCDMGISYGFGVIFKDEIIVFIKIEDLFL